MYVYIYIFNNYITVLELSLVSKKVLDACSQINTAV